MSPLRLLPAIFTLACSSLLSAIGASAPYKPLIGAPTPYGPTPTEPQINWQRMEYYGFVHLGLNTYTDKEWGYGDEDPTLFNPTKFDAQKIVKLFKDSGMKGMILTAKHHDGFCLWPTKSTTHNITKSPWKNGRGNLVHDFAKACAQEGIKFGVYISPWDRNHKDYAKDGYLVSYYTQIQELLDTKKYGEIFEIWFDGANGGDGYYGGAREGRTIPTNYYKFPKIVEMVRKLQPNCVVWGAGSVGDARWGGSEAGHVNYPHWPTIKSQDGHNEGMFGSGQRDGDRWVPAEGDTSIRHGWFWHASANNSVKSPEKLLKVWFECVGRGANFILNVPPDKEGEIYSADTASLLEFKQLRDRLYAKDFALGAKTKASQVRNNNKKSFGPQNLVDNNIESYWSTNDNTTTGEVEITLKAPVTVDVIRLREQIRLGQRVNRFEVDAWVNNNWETILNGESIGNQAMLPLNAPVTTNKFKLRITEAAACPAISEFSLFVMPVVLSAPTITRSATGNVAITAAAGGNIHYTLDGTTPSKESPLYKGEIALPLGGVVKALIIDNAGAVGALASQELSMAKSDWKIIHAPEKTMAQNAIDENPKTFWHTHPNEGELAPPQSFTVDMGKEIQAKGFTYLPRQDGTTHGMTDKYIFETSTDNTIWKKVAEGEFSNLRANPIEHAVNFAQPESVRYFRFTGTKALDKNHVSAAEIGIIPVK